MVILTGAVVQLCRKLCGSDLQLGVLLLPRLERPGDSSANDTTALGAVPQPHHGDICPGEVLV